MCGQISTTMGRLARRILIVFAGQIRSNEYREEFDLNGDQLLNHEDHDAMIRDVLGTTLGDANLDGVFDSSDLVLVFQRDSMRIERLERPAGMTATGTATANSPRTT